jgi:peptidoglycan pentaglycine glycine transferase (the first glycine)
MQVVEIDRNSINNYIASQKHSQFLQSWEWGEFQEKTGKKVIRLGFEENSKPFFALTLIKNSLPLRLNYFYAPRIDLNNFNNNQLDFIISEIKKIAKTHRIIFLRMDLVNDCLILNTKYLIQKTIHVQAEKTSILNIDNSKEDLLKNMHHKTRYNIRLAKKKGVKIRVAEEKDFDNWWRVMTETKERDGFRLHSREYYKKMLKFEIRNSKTETNSKSQILNSKMELKLLLAEFENKIIAGNIVALFGDMAAYVHGASSNQYRNVMAPYLLQWEAIKMAKEKGIKYYDLNGIDENKWPGVTRFKKGFGGKEIKYPGTYDLIFNQMWYNVYGVLRKIRRKI